jgi:hypothetical protein
MPQSAREADADGLLPLYYALKQEDSKVDANVRRYLTDAFRESVRLAGDGGRAALHQALAQRLPLFIVKFLIEEFPEAVRGKHDVGGMIALQCAISDENDVEVVQFLKRRGPQR